MSKIIVDSDEYFKLKEKLNKLSDINKSLKEKYTQLQKKSVVDVGFSIEKYDKLKIENENLKKDITFHKQETNKLEKEKGKLLYDIRLYKDGNTKLKEENNKLNKMLEEFNRPRKSKTEVKPAKKEFNLEEFNKEYNEFIENLKKNKKNETV